MLDERLGVPVPLEDDALGLIVVEVDVVLQRSGVLGPHDLQALSGQALELLEFALVELESNDSLKLTHGSGLQTPAMLTGIDAPGWPGKRPPYPDCRPGNRPAARNDDASIGRGREASDSAG